MASLLITVSGCFLRACVTCSLMLMSIAHTEADDIFAVTNIWCVLGDFWSPQNTSSCIESSTDCKRAYYVLLLLDFLSANKASSCVCSSLIIELSKWYRVCIDAVTLNKVINFCPFNGTPPCRFCGCVLRCQLYQSIESSLFVKWAIAGESRRTSTWRLISRYANLYPLVGSAAPQTLHTLGNTRVQGNYKKWTEDYVMGSNVLLI